MRILMVVGDVPWPPLNGFRLQLRHLVTELSARHQVCVIGFRWPGQVEETIRGVELHAVEAPSLSVAARARVLLRCGLEGAPTSVGVYASGMRGPLTALLRDRAFDVVYASGTNMAGLRDVVRPTPVVVGALDAWHLNMRAAIELDGTPRQLLRRYEEWQGRRFVARAFPEVAQVVMVSQQDAEAIRQLDPRLSPAVIPNGVDAERFAPAPGLADPGHVVFTGALAYPPNVSAARWLMQSIFPHILSRAPGARLSVVGRSPDPELVSLARPPVVEVHPDVPDIAAWLHRAAVYACPMTSGTGIKNKLLEAMACGVPAVATPLACQGMDVRDGEHLLVARDEETFAEAVVRLLSDDTLRARLGDAARSYVLEHHTWSGVAAAFERLFEAAAVTAEPHSRLSA